MWFWGIPLLNKPENKCFLFMRRKRHSLLFRKRRNTLGIALVNSQRSSPSSSEAGSAFGLLEWATVWRALISKTALIFWNSQASSATWGIEYFTPSCMAGLAPPDKGVTKSYHLWWWGPWMCFRASQCRLFVWEMATRLCRGCENFRSCTIWKKFQVFQLL